MGSENVNAKEFLKGYTKPKNYAKSVLFGSQFLIILFIIFSVYTFFKGKTQENQIDLSGSKDAKVTIVQKDKKSIIPFIELGVGKDSGDMETFIRTGIRFEF